MASRRHNPRRAQSHFSYTVYEVAELYEVSRPTVRHWLANGITPNDGSRPFLIHGNELNRFHASRRAAKKHPCGPGIEQIEALVASMPTVTPVDRRNRAIVALIAITGARDNAVASLRLADLDLDDSQLFQDSRHVRTKFRKAFPTWFFPVGDHFVEIVATWKRELQEAHGFGPSAPLFPKTEISFGPDGTIQPARLGTECWANADPIRKLFKEACADAGLPDFKPHSVRHMLAQIGEERSTSAEQMKAWSQNLGHENMLTTFTSYGTIPNHRQRQIVLKMKTSA